MRATMNILIIYIAEVQQLSGQKSKTNAIVVALEEYVRRRQMQALIDLRGNVTIEYDWEREEELEMKAAEERERYHERNLP